MNPEGVSPGRKDGEGSSIGEPPPFTLDEDGKTHQVERVVTNRKIFAVGDIHGCSEKLQALLTRLPLDPAKDFLIFLGDYLNRGPDSQGVIEQLLKVKSKVRHAVFLMGNHEYDLLEYARTGDPDHLREMRPLGLEATLESYGNAHVRTLRDLSFLPEAHALFLMHLLPWFRLGNYLFIHAGIIPGEDVESSPLGRLLRVRDVFLSDRRPLREVVVFGHTPFETPFVTHHRIGIDTGAAYGNLLTAVELPEMVFYHA